MCKSGMNNIQFEEFKNEKISYDKTWETVQNILEDFYMEKQGEKVKVALLNSSELMVVINSSQQRMCENTFSSLKKDGKSLPFGFRAKSSRKWLFSLDAVTKWLIRENNE